MKVETIKDLRSQILISDPCAHLRSYTQAAERKISEINRRMETCNQRLKLLDNCSLKFFTKAQYQTILEDRKRVFQTEIARVLKDIEQVEDQLKR